MNEFFHVLPLLCGLLSEFHSHTDFGMHHPHYTLSLNLKLLDSHGEHNPGTFGKW